MLFKGFQLLFLFMFIFLMMLDGISPITQGSSQSVLDGLLVGFLTKAVLRAMQHVLSLSNSCLVKHAIKLRPVILQRLFPCCLWLSRTSFLAFFLCGTLMDFLL